MRYTAQAKGATTMIEIWDSLAGLIEEYLHIPQGLLVNLVLTVALIVLYAVMRTGVQRLAVRRIEDVARRYIASKSISYLLTFLLLLALLRLWLGGFGGLGTYLGIVSAGLAIALQEPLLNLVGFFFLIVRKPFTTGDRVQIGPHAGDVIDVSLLQFTIVEVGNWVDADQSTGRIIHIPNGWVLKHPTANYTQGFNFVWNELVVTITFESNWRVAKQLLNEIAMRSAAVGSEEAAAQVRQAAQKFMIFFQNLTPIVWTSVAAHGVTLTVRYLCEPRRRRSSAGEIWEAILDTFAEHDDIDLAYPTQRFFNNVAEGSAALRGGSRGPHAAPQPGAHDEDPPPMESEGGDLER